MASAIVGALRVILSADTAEFDSAMKRVSGAAKAWSNDLGQVGRQTTAIGEGLTKTLTLPLLALGASSAKAAMDFESSFAGVRKTVDATEEEFSVMSAAFRNLAKEIPVNVNELNRLGEAAGALGIPKAEIVDFARVMALLGVTTNVTSEQAASSIAKIQNIFGAAGKDTERFASTLVALGNDGASTESEILELGNRIASAGHVAGLSQGEVLGFASAIANVGIQAEAGGSAFSKVLNDMGQAVSKQDGQLRKFAEAAGMTGAEFTRLFREDAAKATQAFIEGLGRMHKSGKDLNIVLDDLGFSEIRQSNLLRSLALSGDNVSKALGVQQKAWSDNSALSKEAGERFKTTESQLTLLWNRIKDVGISLGNALLPTIRAMVDALTAMIPYLESAVNLFGKLPVPVQGAVIAAAAFAAALGPILIVVGQVITSIGAIVGAFTAKGVAMRAITALYPMVVSGLGAVATAIGAAATSFVAIGALVVALAAALYKVGEAFVNLYKHWRDGKPMWDFFTARDEDNFVRRGLKWAGVLSDVKKRTDDIALATDKAAQSTTQFVGPINQVTGATALSEEELKKAKKAAEDFADSLKSLGGRDALSGAEMVVKQLGALGGPLKVLPSQLKAMADRLNEGAQAALLMGRSDLANQYSLLAKTLDPIVMFQQRYNVTIGEYVTRATMAESATADLWEQFHRLTGQVQEIAPVLKNMWPGGALPIPRLKEAVLENLPDAKTWEQAWGGMKDGLERVVDDIPRTLQQAFTGGGGVLGALKSIGVGLAQAFTAPLMAELSKMQKAGVNAGAGLAAALGGATGGGTMATISGIAGQLGGAAVAASAWGTSMAAAGTMGTVALGAATLGIGAAAVGIGLLVKRFATIPPEVKAAREAVTEFEAALRSSLTPGQEAAAGGSGWKATVIAVQDAYLDIGLTAEEANRAVERLWDTDNPERSRQALEEINGVFQRARTYAEGLKTQLSETETELDGLIGKAKDLGYEFNQQGEFIGVNFQTLTTTAQNFGVSLDGLGPIFRQQMIDAEAQKIIDGFTLMSKAGGDVGGILSGMKDEINAVVIRSMQFGTTIPENMQPWVAELVRTRQLTDENGRIIEDLSQIKFGDPVATQFETIANRLKEVVDRLAEVLEKISEIPSQRDFTVRAQYVDPGPPEGFGDPRVHEEGGFRTGTIGRLGEWFGRFPSEGFVTALHGTEAVVTPEQAPMFAADVLGSMSPPMQGGADNGGIGGIGEMFSRLEHTLVTTLPSLAESAARHGAQTAGRRR